jgi:hypothetical protein
MQIPGKLVIRTHAPLRRWLMLLSWVLFTALGLYIVFELGRSKAGFDGIEAGKQRAVLEDKIDALEKVQRDLRVQLAAANETQVAQSQERADVARSIGDLQAQVTAQQRDLEFYRGLAAQPGTKPASVQIQQLKIVPQATSGQYLLRLSLTRAVHQEDSISGTITVSIDGDRAGTATSLDLAAVAGIQRGSLPFSFRFYANMDQLVTLPADFKPQRVTVEVRPARSGVTPYRQTYVWVPTTN